MRRYDMAGGSVIGLDQRS